MSGRLLYNSGHRYRRIGCFTSAIKDSVFGGIAKVTLPNYLIHRYSLSEPPANSASHLHLGCGSKFLPGFLNIDGNLTGKRTGSIRMTMDTGKR